MYNEDYILIFNAIEYEEALNNNAKLSKLENAWLNKYTSPNEVKIDVMDVLFKESLDHYVLKMIKHDESFINTKRFINYLNMIIHIYNKNKIEFNTNIVFRDQKIKEKIFDKYFNKKTLESYIMQKNSYCDELIERINKINNGAQNINIAQEELNYVCEYLAKLRIYGLEENDIVLKYLFGKIKYSNLKLSFQAQDFILMILPYFYKENVNNVRIVLGDTKNGRKIHIGASDGVRKLISFEKQYFSNIITNSIADSNTERTKGTDITFFMIVAFHELTHQVQKEKATKKYYDDQGMSYIIKKILNDTFKDYNINHDTDDIEIDANEKGWHKCCEFYGKYYSGKEKTQLIKNCYINEHTSMIRRLFAYKKDNNDNYLPHYEYDILNIVQIIKNNPNYLKNFPMLKCFFNDNGDLDIMFLTNYDFTMYETAKEYIEYVFNNGQIKDIIPYIKEKKLTNDQIQKLITNLYQYISNNCIKKEKLNYVINHNSVGEYRNLVQLDEELAETLGKMYYSKAQNANVMVDNIFDEIVHNYPEFEKQIEQFNLLKSKYFNGKSK